MTKAAVLAALALGFGFPVSGSAEDQHAQHQQRMQHTQHEQQMPPAAPATVNPVLDLGPDLQLLLKEEMNAVQKGMQDLLPLIAAGEWPAVSTIAARMQQTYIMHQKLSPEQMSQLHQALPAEFIAQDQGFHQMAGMLAHVAEARQLELVTFYYYKLTESCVSCHARFATHHFPALAPPAKDQDHRH